MNRITLLLLVLLNALACQPTKDLIAPGAGLIGSWQYIERGYSPGAGYIVNQIPRKPVQRIDFLPDSTVHTVNMEEYAFSSARSYRIDSTQYGVRLSLFDDVKQPIGPLLTVRFEDSRLKLMPPCFEGCHYGFIRLHN